MKKRFIKILLLFSVAVCATLLIVGLSACGDSKASLGEDTFPHTHSFGNSVIVKEPTCTEEGESECYCSCGISKTQVLPALGHNYVHHDGQEATCTEAGWEEYLSCSRCDYTEFTEIPALEHNFGEWEVTKEASCSENGEAVRICLRDEEHIQTKELPATGHKADDRINVKLPTCETVGLNAKVCSVCGETIDTEEVPSLGHNFGAWIPETESTCITRGCEIRFCANDKNHFETRSTDLAEHDYLWKNDGETHSCICNVCGDEIKNLPHEWIDGVCKICGCEKKEDEEEIEEENIKLSLESYDGVSYTVTGIGTEEENEITIPSFYKNLPVTAIAPNAFRNCSFITVVTIPNGITDIGAGAFYGCKNLIKIDLSNTVESVGEEAFRSCENLTEIVLSETLLNIGNEAFASCVKLKSLIIPSSVKKIGKSAFINCDSLTEVTFENCEGWKICNNDKVIGEINKVYLEDSLETIETINLYQDYSWICD